ncbi:MAG: M23 family metallopeptidase [candidate division WOR-3 bacterium]
MGFFGFYFFSIFLEIDFLWPTEEKGILSSFGEWREDHLHAGIDLPIKKIGEKILSVCDGWVWRVKTSPWGYGKAVYVKSWTGETFVYAHLFSFPKKIEEIVRKEQLRKLSYSTDIWFKEGEILVKRGDVIGYGGNSGCLSPHLHFEMRDKFQKPMDPLIRGFTISDSIPPVITGLRIIPLGGSSRVNGSPIGELYNSIYDTIKVFIEGKAGIEIEVFDKVNGKSGRVGPKEIRLYKGERLIRRELIDKFPYSNYKDSRFLFDFAYEKRTGRKFRKVFSCPGNELPFFEGEDGIIKGEEKGVYLIEVYDAAYNFTSLIIKLIDSLPERKTLTLGKELLFEPYGFLCRGKWFNPNKFGGILKSGDSILVWNLKKIKMNKLRSIEGKCEISIPADANLFTDLIAVKSHKNGDIWEWEPPLPFKKKIKIRIKTQEEKSSIYEKKGKSWIFISSKRDRDNLIGFIDHLGCFGILRDTTKPLLSLKSEKFSSQVPLIIEVDDNLSGVNFHSIKTFIDGKQTVFAYEPQRKRLIFEYPEEIKKGKHILKISLTDNQGNKTIKEWVIIKE